MSENDLVATDTNVATTDTISRQAAISEIMEDLEDRSLHDDPATPEDYVEGYDEGIRNAAAIVLQMPSAQLAQDLTKGCTDTDTLPPSRPEEDIKAMCGECDAWNQYKNPQPGWIPCSERLPEPGECYLVTTQFFGWNCTEYREIDIAKYDFDGWHKANTVLAWCELPKPYLERGQDERSD